MILYFHGIKSNHGLYKKDLFKISYINIFFVIQRKTQRNELFYSENIRSYSLFSADNYTCILTHLNQRYLIKSSFTKISSFIHLKTTRAFSIFLFLIMTDNIRQERKFVLYSPCFIASTVVVIVVGSSGGGGSSLRSSSTLLQQWIQRQASAT